MKTSGIGVVALLLLLACVGGERSVEDTPPEDAPAPVPAPEPAPTPTPAPARDTAWMNGTASREGSLVATLMDVRVGSHEGYDRVVFEFAEAVPGYKVEYIDRPVRQCGSGEVVPLPGDAWLQIRLYPANAHTEEGAPTVAARDQTITGRNIKRLKLICDFEAVVEWVVAVGSPGRFRVLELREPARLVVDIR